MTVISMMRKNYGKLTLNLRFLSQVPENEGFISTENLVLVEFATVEHDAFVKAGNILA